MGLSSGTAGLVGEQMDGPQGEEPGRPRWGWALVTSVLPEARCGLDAVLNPGMPYQEALPECSTPGQVGSELDKQGTGLSSPQLLAWDRGRSGPRDGPAGEENTDPEPASPACVEPGPPSPPLLLLGDARLPLLPHNLPRLPRRRGHIPGGPAQSRTARPEDTRALAGGQPLNRGPHPGLLQHPCASA